MNKTTRLFNLSPRGEIIPAGSDFERAIRSATTGNALFHSTLARQY